LFESLIWECPETRFQYVARLHNRLREPYTIGGKRSLSNAVGHQRDRVSYNISQKSQRIEKKPVPVGTLDITLYRDDLTTLGPKPVVQKTELEFPVAGKSVVLVDDVLYTGRTTRGALDALFRGGRPKRVQLCVLIDRGHRELPIEAAFVGRMVQTTDNQIIEVKLREIDNAEKVLLMEKQ